MFGYDLGIDLGTSSTIIYMSEKGIVLNEPSYVAYNTQNGKMMCAGKRAYEMIGREPQNVAVCQPIIDGVISDFSITEQMLRWFIQQIVGNTIFKPRVMVSMPSMITDVERRTIVSVITSAGARKVCLIEEPLAAAMGAGVEITNPSGTMIVDVGGGTTDIAVITMGSMALTETVKTAGLDFDEAIQKYVRRRWGIQIGMMTAEEIKFEIGCAVARSEELYMSAKGRDVLTGLPRSVEISSSNVLEALEEPLETIRDAIHRMFERTSAQLVGDISQKGIILTGGSSLMYGMAQLVREETGIDTVIAEDPVSCVARGTGNALKNFSMLREYGYEFKTKEDVRVG